MKLKQSHHFARQKKKLNGNQIKELDEALLELIENPAIGDQKLGDLLLVRVHKFRMLGQLCLLAYTYDKEDNQIILLAVGPHENFYRDLKRLIK